MQIKLMLVLIFAIAPSVSFCLEDADDKKGMLIGSVYDGNDSTAMEYVTITVFSIKDSIFIAGGVTRQNGTFSIDNLILDEHYYIKLRFIGYVEKVIKNVILSNKHTDIGTIYLEENAQSIDEVVVTADRTLVENKIDKKVYNADQIISGGTSLDLLRNIPSVQVDENDNISYRGQEGVTILIDGRPISMAPSTYLKMISANSVDKIELIANPSAKFDAEGMSGIINIITKKERQKGFNGNLNGHYGRGINNRWSSNAAISYNTKKVKLHGDYNTNSRNSSTFSYTHREVLLSGTVDRLNSSGTGLNSNYSQTFSGGVDYFLNKNNTIYASGRYNIGDLNMNSEISYENIDENNNSLARSNRNGREWGPLGSHNVNAGWQNTFGKRQATMDFDINYSADFHETYEKITETVLDADNYLTNTFGREDNSLFVNKLDFRIPLNDSTSLETGLKSTMRSQSSDLKVSTFINGDLNLDSTLSDKFNYNETVFAGYFSFEKQLKKFVLKFGLRGEYTHTSSSVLQDTFDLDKSYFQLFPSAFISYNLSEKSSLTFNYGRRINRPRMTMLNPFIYYSDRFLIEQGYPLLSPEAIHVFEIGYSKYSKKLNVDMSIFYRSINNKMRRYLRQDNLVSIISYKNIDQSNLSGMELNVTYKPIEAFTIRYSLNLWNFHIRDEDITNNKTVNTLGALMNLNFSFKLKKDWRMQLRNYMRPKYSVQQGYMLPRYAMSIGLSKHLFNKQLKLDISVSDVLNTLHSHYRSTLDTNYDFRANWEWETRVVYLIANWSFGSKFKVKQKRRLLDNKSSDEGSIPDI